jgi:hypothetical protein
MNRITAARWSAVEDRSALPAAARSRRGRQKSLAELGEIIKAITEKSKTDK